MPSLIPPCAAALVLAALPEGSHTVGSVTLAILGIGFLIFVHELGHFLACRLTKTRVETFSIGFGPRLFGWERPKGQARRFTVGPRRFEASTGAMDVRIAAIPLGGYVKMAGEIGGDGTATSGAGEELRVPQPDEFPAKPLGARVFIISAGVLMNVLTAFVFFWVSYASGLLEVPPVVGDVVAGGPAWRAGLRPGDRITSMDGDTVRTFSDVQSEIVYQKAGEEASVEFLRDGRPMHAALRPEYDPELGLQRAQINPVATWTVHTPGAPDVEVGPTERVLVGGRPARGGMAAYGVLRDAIEVGLASVRVEFPERPAAPPLVIDLDSLRRAPQRDANYRLGVSVLPRLVVEAVAPGGPAAAAGLAAGDEILEADGVRMDRRARLAFRPSIDTLLVRRAGTVRPLHVGAADAEAVAALLADLTFVSKEPDGRVLVVPSGGEFEGGKSPAGEAGVLPFDQVLEIDGRRIASAADVVAAGKALTGAPVTLKVATGDAPPRTIRVTPRPIRDFRLEAERFALESPKEPVPVDGLLDAARIAAGRTVGEVRNIFRLIGRFFGHEISFSKNVGGPLTIANLSSRSASEGLGRFLAFLAFISVNLAVLNVLPIPVLDGGHLLFLAIERLRGGRPLTEATIAKLQLVGFALLMLLMVFALKNDIGNVFGR